MGFDPEIFPQRADFDPSADFDAFLVRVPARWVVYLLADDADRPIQLLCVRNLRSSLKRRLGGQEIIGPSRRVNYRDVVRRIFWRRVDSAFEADWIYLEAARQVFPESYQGMVGFRPAWFIHVNPETEFPRYTKTIDLSKQSGLLIGPVEDKHAAARLMQMAEDCFDLCRYYNILLQAPEGKACAYKEMGKCPAPCDGSISMENYRQMIRRSALTLINPEEFVREQTSRMQKAAASLQFEAAAKIKALVDQAFQFRRGPFRHARLLEDFVYLSVQRGPREGTAKLFLTAQGEIEEVLGLIHEPGEWADLISHLSARITQSPPAPISRGGAERVGLVAQHLFSGPQHSGVFLHAASMELKSLARAFREIAIKKAAEPTDDEGVLKELQAM